MELKRLKDQLEKIRAQIDLVEDAQSYEIESNGSKRKVTHADLNALYERESVLLLKIKRLTGRSHSRSVLGE
jgi:hypothetical protein